MPRVYISKKANKTDKTEIGTWSDSIKAKAAMLYSVTGSINSVVKELNVPIATATYWSKQKWWDDLVQAIYREQDAKINGKVTDLIDKALVAVEDRIVNGDFQYNPQSGEMVRVPVKAQVLGRIQTDLSKQRKEYTSKPSEREAEDKDRLNEKLSKLADAFTSFVKKKSDTTEERMVNQEFEVLSDGTIIDGNGDIVEDSRIKDDPFNYKSETR